MSPLISRRTWSAPDWWLIPAGQLRGVEQHRVAARVASNNGEEQSGSLVRLACGLLLQASNSNDRRPRHHVERLSAADAAGLDSHLRDEPSHLIPDFIRPPVVLELLGAHFFMRLRRFYTTRLHGCPKRLFSTSATDSNRVAGQSGDAHRDNVRSPIQRQRSSEERP